MHHAVLRSFFDRGKGKSAVYAVQGGASTDDPCRGREVWPGALGMPAKFAGYSCRGGPCGGSEVCRVHVGAYRIRPPGIPQG